jgi:hypothetical protein
MYKQEFMWGVHNTRLLADNPTLRCPMCGKFTSNGHLAGTCPSMAGLLRDRHSIALQLLICLLERHNGGRWEIITEDLGSKAIKSFVSPITIISPVTTTRHHVLTCLPALLLLTKVSEKGGRQAKKPSHRSSTVPSRSARSPVRDIFAPPFATRLLA